MESDWFAIGSMIFYTNLFRRQRKRPRRVVDTCKERFFLLQAKYKNPVPSSLVEVPTAIFKIFHESSPSAKIEEQWSFLPPRAIVSLTRGERGIRETFRERKKGELLGWLRNRGRRRRRRQQRIRIFFPFPLLATFLR